MFYFFLLFFLFSKNNFPENLDTKDLDIIERTFITKDPLHSKVDYEWVVVGGGVAGIIAIAVLHDLGIPFESIYWIDPLFNVGRIGEYYLNVVGNTPNSSWIDFLNSSRTISDLVHEDITYLETLNPKEFNTLAIVANPMQKVTDYFLKMIDTKKGFMDYLEFYDNIWHIGVADSVKTSRNVILATGCHPKIENYSINSDIIPLDYALDPEKLRYLVKPQDSIAVFGGSHSAILILKYLSHLNVLKILNFYKYPLLYAIDMGNWTLNSTNGLRGETAKWACEVLEKNPPKNLVRIKNTEENRKKNLPFCNKIIYAIGYEKNQLPEIDIENDTFNLSFEPETGIIGTRIFGIGLAFPGEYIGPTGDKEQLISLKSFMKFALMVVPEWIKTKYHIEKDPISLRIHQLSFLDNFLQINLL